MGGGFTPYNLRGDVQKYLDLDESGLDALFQGYSRFKIHKALGGTQNHYQDSGTPKERRNYFKKRLIT